MATVTAALSAAGLSLKRLQIIRELAVAAAAGRLESSQCESLLDLCGGVGATARKARHSPTFARVLELCTAVEPFDFVKGIADARSLPGHSKRFAVAVVAACSGFDCGGGPIPVPAAEPGLLRRGAHNLADPMPGWQGIFGRPSAAVTYARSAELEPTCQVAKPSAGPEGQPVEPLGLAAELCDVCVARADRVARRSQLARSEG